MRIIFFPLVKMLIDLRSKVSLWDKLFINTPSKQFEHKIHGDQGGEAEDAVDCLICDGTQNTVGTAFQILRLVAQEMKHRHINYALFKEHLNINNPHQ